MSGAHKQAGETGPDTGMATHQPFSADRKAEYCVALEDCGRPIEACRRVGVHRATVSLHTSPEGKYFDPDFALAMNEAMAAHREHIEAEVYRRGVKGVVEPIYYQGVRIMEVIPGTEDDVDEGGLPNQVRPAGLRKYSDRMLELYAKRHIPEYRDKLSVDQRTVTVDAGLADLKALPREARIKLREALELAGETDGSA